MSKRIFIIIILVFITFIALRAATYFLRPLFEERFLKAVKETLGGDIGLSKFDISLPRGIIKLGGFKVTDSKLIKYQTTLAADEIILDIDLLGTVLQKKLIFQKIYLKNPFFSLKNVERQISQGVAISSGREISDVRELPSKSSKPLPRGKFDTFYIKKLIVKNFKFNFTDYTVPSPPAVINIVNINGRFDDFSMSLLEEGNFRGAGHIAGEFDSEEKGQIALDGTFNKIKEGVDFDFKLVLKDLDLTYFSPYYSNMSFTILQEAKVDMDSSAACMQSKINASQNVRIYDIKLDETTLASEDMLFGLPAVTVINFFKDSENDEIKFSFNIRGTLNDPEFDLGPLIKQVLSNALRKKIASKLKKLPEEIVKIGEDAIREGLDVGKKLKILDKDTEKVIEDMREELEKIIDY